ncbi:hypothetical protein GCM10022256_33580 [Frondihabitans peucedani]|uniref:Uncharacterized protein n=1 Tax=Frondihabitans peucedani TaxID=598626 RepID=A0ABP8E6P4_9MICO
MSRAGRLGKHPKRLASGLYGRLPWYGKVLVSLATIASGLRLLDWMVGLFV